MSYRKRTILLAALLLISGQKANAASLFDDLGQKPGIVRLVDQAVKVWSTDPRVGPTFEDTNMTRFKRLFVDQICQISGGDCRYTGRSMAEAHKGLHLATVQFNAISEDVQTAMGLLDIPYSVQNRLLALLAPMHRDVVTR